MTIQALSSYGNLQGCIGNLNLDLYFKSIHLKGYNFKSKNFKGSGFCQIQILDLLKLSKQNIDFNHSNPNPCEHISISKGTTR